MENYKEVILAAKASRNTHQLEQAKDIQSRVERYNQQRSKLFAARTRREDEKVNQMVNIFKPRISELNNN